MLYFKVHQKRPEELLQSIILTATDLLDCEVASMLLYNTKIEEAKLCLLQLENNHEDLLFDIFLFPVTRASRVLYLGKRTRLLFRIFIMLPGITIW